MTGWHDLDGPRRREPKRLADILDIVLGRVGGEAAPAMLTLTARWEEIAGPSWKGSRPTALNDGVLVVSVPNGAAASLAKLGVPELKRRLARHVGDGCVRDIRIRVARPQRGG